VVIRIINGNINPDNLKLEKDTEQAVSVITRIELLAYPGINADEEHDIEEFLSGVDIIPLTTEVEAETIKIRRSYIRFILVGAPFMAASQALNNQLRFQGSSIYAMPFMGWTILCNMMAQPMGKAKIASLLAFGRQGLFLLPLLLILTPAFGLPGIQLSPPMADICSFFFSIPFIVRIFRKELNEKSGEGGRLYD
jgi:Na+-driven multidrug efflux pump